MQTTESLKRQIDTAEDLSTVVRTMKTLAAVNIRQFEAAAESMEEYDRTIRMAVRMVLWNDAHRSDERTNRRKEDATGPPRGVCSGRTVYRVGVRDSSSGAQQSGHAGLIAFGSDQGMCGGFNEAILNQVEQWLRKHSAGGRSVPMIVLGRRLAGRLADAGHTVECTIDLPGAATGITLMLQELLPRIDHWRNEHVLESVVVCHNRRLSQTQYEPVCQALLPISPSELVPERPMRWPGRSLPLVTMSSHGLWQSIARQHLFVSLFQSCAESQTSENAARIAAMQAAETHIRDRLSDLGRDYQQLRQTSITEELLDVISGFEALTAT